MPETATKSTLMLSRLAKVEEITGAARTSTVGVTTGAGAGAGAATGAGVGVTTFVGAGVGLTTGVGVTTGAGADTVVGTGGDDNIDLGAGAFSIAVFPAVSILQKRFYPQFNITVPDYSFIAALKLKQQETHWRKGHKFVQIVIQ